MCLRQFMIKGFGGERGGGEGEGMGLGMAGGFGLY
jgi:hypothetical protein